MAGFIVSGIFIFKYIILNIKLEDIMIIILMDL